MDLACRWPTSWITYPVRTLEEKPEDRFNNKKSHTAANIIPEQKKREKSTRANRVERRWLECQRACRASKLGESWQYSWPSHSGTLLMLFVSYEWHKIQLELPFHSSPTSTNQMPHGLQLVHRVWERLIGGFQRKNVIKNTFEWEWHLIKGFFFLLSDIKVWMCSAGICKDILLSQIKMVAWTWNLPPPDTFARLHERWSLMRQMKDFNEPHRVHYTASSSWSGSLCGFQCCSN